MTRDEGELRPGQRFRSLRLRDYEVVLVGPAHHGLWYTEPYGTSSYGSHVTPEAYLIDPARFVLVTGRAS